MKKNKLIHVCVGDLINYLAVGVVGTAVHRGFIVDMKADPYGVSTTNAAFAWLIENYPDEFEWA